jgi:hypothetical protein
VYIGNGRYSKKPVKQWLLERHSKKETVDMAHRYSSSQAQSFTKPSSIRTASNGGFELQENTPGLQHKY